MKNTIDMIGKRFGRLVVLEFVGGPPTWNSYVTCQCDCGNIKTTRATSVREMDTRSCGCLCRETTARIGRSTKKHGHSGSSRGRIGPKASPEYYVWAGMLDRCRNKHNKKWHLYGGRGISVCADWSNSFATFLRDIGPRPSPKHSIDRIDNNGNYEPGNVRWATRSEQGRNTRYNRILTVNGVSKTVAEWVEETGFSKSMLTARVGRGWPDDRIVLEPRHLSKVRNKP